MGASKTTKSVFPKVLGCMVDSYVVVAYIATLYVDGLIYVLSAYITSVTKIK